MHIHMYCNGFVASQHDWQQVGNLCKDDTSSNNEHDNPELREFIK